MFAVMIYEKNLSSNLSIILTIKNIFLTLNRQSRDGIYNAASWPSVPSLLIGLTNTTVLSDERDFII